MGQKAVSRQYQLLVLPVQTVCIHSCATNSSFCRRHPSNARLTPDCWANGTAGVNTRCWCLSAPPPVVVDTSIISHPLMCVCVWGGGVNPGKISSVGGLFLKCTWLVPQWLLSSAKSLGSTVIYPLATTLKALHGNREAWTKHKRLDSRHLKRVKSFTSRYLFFLRKNIWP